MRKKHIYTYTISLLLGVFSHPAVSQTASPTVVQTATNTAAATTSTRTTIALPEKETATVYKQRYGLRIGADLSKLVLPFFNSNYYGLELVGDYRLTSNYYAAAEIGTERKTTDEDFFKYTTQGQFLRLGFDYNSYGNWYGMENMIYAGARYGLSVFSQDLTAYTLHKDNQYWNEDTSGHAPQFLGKHDGRTAHWLEIVLGLKAELLRNLYAGMSVRVGVLVAQTGVDEFPNYYLPAFGRVHEGSRFGTSFNYTLSYLIPLYKREKKKETEATEERSPAPTLPSAGKRPQGRRR
ncbi:MAG: DUF6048 family protein [Capnocytophaga sp.]|uniref:DUF6048 family protein n=1 Tax=Capnocytophaga sp. TaxID=44737 RepID=UPI003FA0B4F2